MAIEASDSTVPSSRPHHGRAPHPAPRVRADQGKSEPASASRACAGQVNSVTRDKFASHEREMLERLLETLHLSQETHPSEQRASGPRPRRTTTGAMIVTQTSIEHTPALDAAVGQRRSRPGALRPSAAQSRSRRRARRAVGPRAPAAGKHHPVPVHALLPTPTTIGVHPRIRVFAGSTRRCAGAIA